ncbi:MAG TPA: aminopeptidase, partial [Oceanithermus sp.]|nr:aminopeptidase [Oceanithermus sp.]
NGVLVRGLEVRFEDGVAVEVRAEEGLEAVRALLATDEGAKRLGEVALVPADSGVRRAGVLFLNTLFDENAASHLAFGQAYSENLKDADRLAPEARKARGMNESLVHQDWMIGSEEVDVLGVREDGREVVLMERGRWAFAV